MPLHLVLPQILFEKWWLDCFGLIKLVAHGNQARCIIVAMEYMTKWVEARIIQKVDAHSSTKFIYELIITRFECPI